MESISYTIGCRAHGRPRTPLIVYIVRSENILEKLNQPRIFSSNSRGQSTSSWEEETLYKGESLILKSILIMFEYQFLCFLMHNCGQATAPPLQCSCLENPMDGGAWWAAVHGVVKSRTRLSDFTFTFHFHALEKEMATHSSVLAWRIPGTGDLVGCHLWGRTESDTTEAT